MRASLRGDELVDGDVARALGARDAERHDRLVEQAREGARLGGAVGHRRQFVEPHAAVAGQRNRRRGEVGDGARAGQRADRLFLAGEFGAAAAEVDIVGAQLRVDLRRGDAERQQLVGVERDADLAVDAAEALDLADALHALQLARDACRRRTTTIARRSCRAPKRRR